MPVDTLKSRILHEFAFPPTTEQEKAIDAFTRFLACPNSMSAMIMRGCAGTGKTTLSGAIVRTLLALRQKVILLAPTGRAAKVFSLGSGHPAFTIHRRIYRERKMAGIDSTFSLNDNLCTNTLFMVDEASMVSNLGLGNVHFGSGCLLDDLVRFVYQGAGCRLMLIGDKAQLPPVGEQESPALSASVLHGYGLDVYECDLNEVLRQSSQSGILYNATVIRRMITLDGVTGLPLVRFSGFADIVYMPGNELVESLSDSYRRVGIDDTMVVTRSNKRAVIYNNGIRNMVLDREEELSRGDMLMIVKNSYYWTDQEKANGIKHLQDAQNAASNTPESFKSVQTAKEELDAIPTFLANGDRAKVLRVSHNRNLYGFHFATLLLQFPDYDNYEISVTALIDTLQSEAASLSADQQEQLFTQVESDYSEIPHKADRLKAIRQDPYYNALQVKYAYAVTCHKAQGGQWAHVYVDQGYMTDDMLTPDYIHWLYTAFTRATEKLFLVNWPKTQTDTGIH